MNAPSADPRDDLPLRDGTSLMGFLHILRKSHVDIVGTTQAHARFRQLSTRGHAKAYINEMMHTMLPEREKRRRLRMSDHKKTNPPGVSVMTIHPKAAVTRVTWRDSSGLLAFCALAIIIVLWTLVSHETIDLHPKPDLITLVPGIFGSLLLVSLFVERMIEVFISIWADQKTEAFEQTLDLWQLRQQQLAQSVKDLIAERNGSPGPDAVRKSVIDTELISKQALLEVAADQINTAQLNLVPFAARTRMVSTWVGLMIGVLTSAVGFRFLSQILTLSPEFIKGTQYEWFVVCDVLLTGAVLAGGSKSVHQIFSVYESFMDSAQRKLKQ